MFTDINYILKIKEYKNAFQYTYYKKDLYNHNKKKNKKEVNKDESNRCSLSRTCSLIKEYVLNNDFDYFFTLTLKHDFRNDVLKSVNYINNAIQNYKKQCNYRGIDFIYIYVYEKQKNGGIHLHGFFKGFYDLYQNKYGHLSSRYFDNVGFQNFQLSEKVNPFYLIKYIEKEPLKELKHKFYKSKNLKKADIIILHDNLQEFANLPYTFTNQFCSMLTIVK